MATGYQLQNASMEGQLFELALAMELLEKATPAATRQNRVSVGISVPNGTITIQASFDADVINQSGHLSIAAKEYLSSALLPGSSVSA